MADIDLATLAALNDHSGRHEQGGDDELDVEGLSGVLDDQQDPQSHGNDRHTDNYVPDTELGSDGGVATLNSSGVLTSGQVPDLAITEVSTVETEDDLTTLSDVQIGDVGIVTDSDPDTNNSYILTGDPSSLDNWSALQTPTSPVQSVNGETGDVDLDSSDVSAPSQSDFDDHSSRHESGGADEISVEGLSGDLADEQDPKSHGNDRHTTNYADDAHDHSESGEGAEEISPDKVDAGSQLDPPTVATRDDIPSGQTGLYYVEDEDTVTYRAS